MLEENGPLGSLLENRVSGSDELCTVVWFLCKPCHCSSPLLCRLTVFFGKLLFLLEELCGTK